MPAAILIGVNASSVPAGYLPMGVHLLTEDRWSRLPGAGGELSRWSAGGLVGRTGTLAVFAAPVADGAALQVTAMTVGPGVQSNGWPVTISTTMGRSVTVTADIANAGGLSGIFRIELTIDGEARDAVTVVAEPGETVTVTMSASDIEDGEHAVSVLDRTSRFRAGTTVDWALIIISNSTALSSLVIVRQRHLAVRPGRPGPGRGSASERMAARPAAPPPEAANPEFLGSIGDVWEARRTAEQVVQRRSGGRKGS
jgi:hypothetical protein